MGRHAGSPRGGQPRRRCSVHRPSVGARSCWKTPRRHDETQTWLRLYTTMAPHPFTCSNIASPRSVPRIKMVSSRASAVKACPSAVMLRLTRHTELRGRGGCWGRPLRLLDNGEGGAFADQLSCCSGFRTLTICDTKWRVAASKPNCSGACKGSPWTQRSSSPAGG